MAYLRGYPDAKETVLLTAAIDGSGETNDYKGLTLTADSHLAAVVQSDQQSNVWLAPAADGKNAAQITSSNYDGFDGLAWLPDGRLLFSASRNNAMDLWLTDTQGKERIPLD